MVKKGNSSKEFFSLIGRQEDSPKGATFSKNYLSNSLLEIRSSTPLGSILVHPKPLGIENST